MRHHTAHADDSLRYLRALGDPDRLHIVQLLRIEPKSVGDICRTLRSPIANVSHHLRMLKEAGIVSAVKRGRFVIYRLNHVVAAAEAGTHVLDFGCCRVEFAESRVRGGARAKSKKSQTVNDQALLILNRILGQMPPGKSADGARTKKSSSPRRARSRQIKIVNPSFERPATAFFDTSVDGWTKEGDPSGTGVFRNFPDDTPLPGSRMIRNADGVQLATLGARNPGRRAGGPSALFQSLPGATYRAGASYVLSLGVGISSVQPPVGGSDVPAKLRFALTFTDDAGKRREVVGRSVTTADVIAGQRGGRKGSAERLVYFSVAATVAPKRAARACAGRSIGILITTAENTAAHAGHFIVDNVSLAADLPSRALPQHSNRR